MTFAIAARAPLAPRARRVVPGLAVRPRAHVVSLNTVAPRNVAASSSAALGRRARPALLARTRPRLLRGDLLAPRATDESSSSPDALLATRPAGPEVDLGAVFSRFKQVATPFWVDESSAKGARLLLAGVVALTLGTTAISVGFNFLGRDFYNSIAEKQPDDFDRLLKTYVAAIAGAIPVFVTRDYYQSVLTLRWRAWMTERYVEKYLGDRNFYHIQTGGVIDNPDQRIVDDISSFTATTVGLAFTLLNAGVDLVSFSGILLGIYEPLVAVLFVYAAGGTLISAKLGQPLVGLNFQQEAREADFRYGLVRVRENAESVAFYGGEAAERGALVARLRAAVDNFGDLLVATRNVDFFTSCYRYLVTFLPAAVVAPLYFKGEIEFGVINQSSSAFSHILGDVSLVVYQIERLASFSAVTDRLGQMTEVLAAPASTMVAPPGEEGRRRILRAPEAAKPFAAKTSAVTAEDAMRAAAEAASAAAASATGGLEGGPRLTLRDLTVRTPGRAGLDRPPLVKGLNLAVKPGGSVLVTGPSGAGKTSLLRAVAGLWEQGDGEVRWGTSPEAAAAAAAFAADDANAPNATDTGGLYFVPQRPYLVLGTLRQQLLYPTWVQTPAEDETSAGSNPGAGGANGGNENAWRCGVLGCPPKPSDAALEEALREVNLGYLLERSANNGGGAGDAGNPDPDRAGSNPAGNVGLDAAGDWSSMLSLGEQQRLAFARVLLARPPVAMLDEATSALDAENEAKMYRLIRNLPDTAYVSVGHRMSLVEFHDEVLRLGGDSTWRVLEADAFAKELERA